MQDYKGYNYEQQYVSIKKKERKKKIQVQRALRKNLFMLKVSFK